MANKKVKGARANKPNDSFGTINNDDLYKNSQYSKDLDKDDDEVEQSEENASPVEETATQQKESSESFASKKEEVDYKKRYDDLKRHYDLKVAEWKDKEKEVQKAPVSETPVKQPEFTANMAQFKSQYPDVYDAVEQLSAAKAESTISALKKEVDALKTKESTLQKQKSYEELLRLQPDFENLKTNDNFLKWLENQPESISNGIYNNNTDAQWASRVVDLYKADTGSKGTRLSKKADAASSVSSPTPREISSKGGNERVWKASEIERLKPWEFEKFEKEIDKARSEGRLDLSQ